MSVTTAHVLYAVNINDAVDVLIDQISDQNIDAGINQMIAGGDGAIYNHYAAVAGQSPRLSFTTSALKTALDKCASTGLALDTANPTLEMYFQAVTEGGTRAGASSHYKLTVSEGLLLPRTIEAPHNAVATISYEAIATWDGANDPIVIAGSQSLAGTAAVDEMFTAGAVKINGSALTGIQNISIAFGITEMVLGDAGEVWPTFVAVQSIQPIITVTSLDAAAINTFALEGAKQGATDSVVYLRKLDKNGTRVADATEEHISFTIDDGRIAVQNVGGSHGAPLASVVQITPTYDGTNAPLVMDTTAAIA